MHVSAAPHLRNPKIGIPGVLHVRYCAFFAASRTQSSCVELLLSLLTLEQHVAPYIDLRVVIYTLAVYRDGLQRLSSHFKFPFSIVALDIEFAAKYAEWSAVANSIQHALPVDRLCVVRMFADFHILPVHEHRLMIGCDVFFLKVPQELLAFVWRARKTYKVLYLSDVYSFAGVPYRLRYYHPPILEGLVGDFYCLAPEVHLHENAIHGCLKMIDDWPTVPGRWDPPLSSTMVHACEQQAAAILLQPFKGESLPVERYANNFENRGLTVFHGHATKFVVRLLDEATMARSRAIVEDCM
jgi:hypothetical protein